MADLTVVTVAVVVTFICVPIITIGRCYTCAMTDMSLLAMVVMVDWSACALA